MPTSSKAGKATRTGYRNMRNITLCVRRFRYRDRPLRRRDRSFRSNPQSVTIDRNHCSR